MKSSLARFWPNADQLKCRRLLPPHRARAAWVSLAAQVVQSRAKHFQIAAKTWGVGVADWSKKKQAKKQLKTQLVHVGRSHDF